MRRSPRSSSRISSRSRRAQNSSARLFGGFGRPRSKRADASRQTAFTIGPAATRYPQGQRSGAPDSALGWDKLPGTVGRNGRLARAGQSSLPEDNVMKAWIVATAVSAAMALAGPAAAQAPIVIKFSHVVTADTPKGKGALKFQELAEKYTNGKVKVDVYPNSSLYKDKEELEALQLGAVQILAPSISKFGPLGVKEFDVFDLPFLMSDDARARQMFASPMMGELNKKLEAKGVTPLSYWDNGAHVYTSNKPLIVPDDFKGLKMRIQGSKVLDAVARELGAIPQIIAFGELYQTLQTGVADGEDNVPSNIWTQKLHEVQKYLTVTYHGRLTYALVTNKKFWDGLTADVREPLG